MSVRVPGKIGAKQLSAELKALASQAVTITDDGTPVTRAELLAELIWKLALGWTERGETPEGRPFTKQHPPVAWAMQFLHERIEGKAPVAIQEEQGGIKALDKVRQLSVDRINKLAKPSPPKFKQKAEVANGTEGSGTA